LRRTTYEAIKILYCAAALFFIMASLRIALANIRRGEGRDESVCIAEQAVAEAGKAGASIVCFPECYVPGYRTPDDPGLPPDSAFLDAAWKRIADAARAANVAVLLGTERIVDGSARLTVLVFNRNGSLAGIQDKVQLDPSEDNAYVAGAGRELFHVDGVPFGIVICHEGWRYPETVRAAARQGAKIVFHPHYHWPEGDSFRPTEFADPRNTFHEKAVLCRAAENTVWFASVNCAVEGSGTTSAIARPDGSLHAFQPYGQEGQLNADIDQRAATGLLASRCRV
jgi:predicted amidohydrolase